MSIWTPDSGNLVFQGDNLDLLRQLPDSMCQLVYIDPPFNTGKRQARYATRNIQSAAGSKKMYGKTYTTVLGERTGYMDRFDNYQQFLTPRLFEARRILNQTGTLYVHLDYREAHYVKTWLDQIFGRDNFLNEIVWAYDFGGRAKNRWPAKHDTILVYVKNMKQHFFNQDQIGRIPYMAPGLVSSEKAAKGKLPTDVWWHTIVAPQSKQRTGYPTQKPQPILERIVQASSKPGDWVVDFFAGSGTTGAACETLGRRYVLADNNPKAVNVMLDRLPNLTVVQSSQTPPAE